MTNPIEVYLTIAISALAIFFYEFVRVNYNHFMTKKILATPICPVFGCPMPKGQGPCPFEPMVGDAMGIGRQARVIRLEEALRTFKVLIDGDMIWGPKGHTEEQFRAYRRACDVLRSIP